MQSRQIQVFGVIGSAVLILFIVIFLGRDFHSLFHKYSESLPFSPLNEAPQEVKKTSGVVVESEVVSEKAVVETENRNNENIGKKSLSVMQSVKEAGAEENLPAKVTGIIESKQKKKVSEVATDAKKPVVSNASSSLSMINKEIRTMLRAAPFFQHSMALTSKNKKVLDQVSKKIAVLSSPFILRIEGHTEAGIATNVSEVMAERVGAYLRRKLPGVQIRMVGYANEYPIIDDPKNKENRRIEILIKEE